MLHLINHNQIKDVYYNVYLLFAGETPSKLTFKAISNFFNILPDNYDQRKLLNIMVESNSLLNILEPAYNKELYLLVDDFLCAYKRGLKRNRYTNIEITTLIMKIKTFRAIDNLSKLGSIDIETKNSLSNKIKSLEVKD